MDADAIDPEALRLRGLGILRPSTKRLMELAASGDPHLSELSVMALGKIGDPISMELLASLFEDDSVSGEAVRALNSIEDPRVMDLLLEGSQKASPKMIAACAEALGPWLGRDPRILKRILELLGHSFPPVRVSAVRGLGPQGGPEAKAALLGLIEDSDPEVAVAALQSLRNFEFDEDEVQQLDAVLDSSSEPKVRASVAELLRRFPHRVAVPVLKKALRDSDARVRANAIEALHNLEGIQDRRLLALLKPMDQEGENNRVQANVAMALGELEPPTSVRILSRLLNSTDKWERASAVYAARNVRNERVANWLTVQLGSEDDEDVLRNILSSLEFFEGENVTRCFLRGLEHENPFVRAGAAKALGGTQDVDVENQLIRKLDEEQDQTVLCEVIRSLGRMCDSTRIPLIAAKLQHPDLRVQATAIEALAEIGTVEIVPHVEPFVNSSDNRVKANAAVSMWNSGNLDVAETLTGMMSSPSLKQRSSAVYALGELGESLRHLESVNRFFLLASSLRQGSLAFDVSMDFPRAMAEGETEPAKSGGPEKDFPFEDVLEFFQKLEARDAPGALGHLQDSLKRSPGNLYLHFLRGDVARRKRKLDKAALEFEKVSEGAPEFLNAHLFLANLYQETKDVPRSLEAYFRGVLAQLEIFRDYAEAGLELLEKKKTNEASLLLKDLIQRVPLEQAAHLDAGLDFIRTKAYEKAMDHLSKAYTTRPTHGELKVGLAYAFFKQKQYTRSRTLCEEVLEKHAKDEALVLKAKSLLQVLDKGGV